MPVVQHRPLVLPKHASSRSTMPAEARTMSTLCRMKPVALKPYKTLLVLDSWSSAVHTVQFVRKLAGWGPLCLLPIVDESQNLSVGYVSGEEEGSFEAER